MLGEVYAPDIGNFSNHLTPSALDVSVLPTSFTTTSFTTTSSIASDRDEERRQARKQAALAKAAGFEWVNVSAVVQWRGTLGVV